MTDDMEDLQETYPGAGTFRFGDSAALCARLNALVRTGAKRATCGAATDFVDDPAALPVVGRCDIATDWDGTPALVIRTTAVERIRFRDVTEELALAEGEGSLADWQAAHRRFFQRNGGFDPDMELIFERFDLVEDLGDR